MIIFDISYMLGAKMYFIFVRYVSLYIYELKLCRPNFIYILTNFSNFVAQASIYLTDFLSTCSIN